MASVLLHAGTGSNVLHVSALRVYFVKVSIQCHTDKCGSRTKRRRFAVVLVLKQIHRIRKVREQFLNKLTLTFCDRTVSGMAVDADHPTTMAVVSVDATGERDFSFYRSANADVMLSKEDISDEALKAAKIVHFGSVSLTADPSRTATLDAAARAKKLGAVITYDPNYRANLWKNKEDAIAQMKAPLPRSGGRDRLPGIGEGFLYHGRSDPDQRRPGIHLRLQALCGIK